MTDTTTATTITAWKLVRPDGRTLTDVWPLHPGGVATGDLTVAKTARGLASAGFSSSTLLRVEFSSADIADEDDHTARIVGPVKVAAVIDWHGAIRRGRNPLADLRGANLKAADFRRAALSWADLEGAHLDRALLRRAGMEGARLREARLIGADLEGVYLRRGDLRGANLHEANLRGANLQRADLRGANLRWANVTGADFWRADLRGANLWGAELEYSRFLPPLGPRDLTRWSVTIA